jgi:hypothetical protein
MTQGVTRIMLTNPAESIAPGDWVWMDTAGTVSVAKPSGQSWRVAQLLEDSVDVDDCVKAMLNINTMGVN